MRTITVPFAARRGLLHGPLLLGPRAPSQVTSRPPQVLGSFVGRRRGCARVQGECLRAAVLEQLLAAAHAHLRHAVLRREMPPISGPSPLKAMPRVGFRRRKRSRFRAAERIPLFGQVRVHGPAVDLGGTIAFCRSPPVHIERHTSSIGKHPFASDTSSAAAAATDEAGLDAGEHDLKTGPTSSCLRLGPEAQTCFGDLPVDAFGTHSDQKRLMSSALSCWPRSPQAVGLRPQVSDLVAVPVDGRGARVDHRLPKGPPTRSSANATSAVSGTTDHHTLLRASLRFRRRADRQRLIGDVRQFLEDGSGLVGVERPPVRPPRGAADDGGTIFERRAPGPPKAAASEGKRACVRMLMIGSPGKWMQCVTPSSSNLTVRSPPPPLLRARSALWPRPRTTRPARLPP